MSDTSQGPGWWQASDGKWYPPEQAPGGGGGGTGGPGQFAAGGGGLNTGEALSYGWNKFVQYLGQIIVIVLIIFAIEIVFQIIRAAIQASIDSVFLGLAVGFFFSAIGLFLVFLLQAGLIRVGLAVTRGQAPEPGMLFRTERLGPYAVASILVALLTFVGFLFCCVGALVVLFFMLFYGYYVIDRDSAPLDSLKLSFDLVKNNAGDVIVFAIVVVVLDLITCGLASGVTRSSVAYASRQLNGEPVA